MLRYCLGALCVVLGVGVILFDPAQAQEGTGVPIIVAPPPGAGGAESPSMPEMDTGVPQVPGRPVLSGIIIEGTQRIEPETVETYMTVRTGDPFSVSDMNASHKALFATGLFADVTIRREGTVLIIRVVENPIINRIAFEGNLRINDEVLSQEVQLRPRIVYTRTRVQSDVKRILEVYRRSGRFGATVDPKIIQLDQNRVDLVFEIEEGPLTGIDRISFIGNKKYSDRTLRGEIFTTESRWWRFYSASDNYDPDQVAFDKESIRRFYLKKGFADFRVVSAVAELTPDKDAFYVTFTLEEGERYRFGKMDVTSQINDIDIKELMDKITIDEGDWYNAEEIEDTVQALTDAIGDLGYAFADVRPNVKKDREGRIIDITFEVQEGRRVYVERIDIGGNVRTLDKVIRREFRLVEGDAFNAAKMRRSRDRVRNLGFFSRAEVTQGEGSAPDKTIVNLDVEEKSTGELGFGIGYSTTDGPLANIVLRERNLLGKGQDIRATVTVSGTRQEFDIGFTEPYFLNRNLAAGIDLFHITQQGRNLSSYSTTRTGSGLRLGYEITERWSQRLRYTIRQDVVENVPAFASLAIKQQEGTTLTSLIGQDLTFDVRDKRVDPTKGFFSRLSTDYAGLGGDVSHVKVRLVNRVYVSLTESIVASLTVTGGIVEGLNEAIEGIDNSVRITDRFFLGGDTLRGFRASGVGPRDLASDDSLGGKQVYYGSLSLRFPIGLPDELGITGSLFTDFGSLSDIDEQTGPICDPDPPGACDLIFTDLLSNIVDEPSLRASWGVGLSWNSPVGPLRLDFAWPLAQEDFDKTEVFRLRFGTRF